MLACLAAAALAGTSTEAATKAGGTTLLKGRTGQHQRVKLKLQQRSLKLIHFNIKLRCRDGSILIDEESGFEKTPVRHSGHFGEVQEGSTDTVMIRGRLRGKRVNGRLRVKDRLGKVRCDSHWVSFKAQH